MDVALSITGLDKTYASGLQALRSVNLEIKKGELFALLGPNGAGKTTLINIVCGIVTASAGQVLADGHDIGREFRAARSKIGLVPQELTTEAFETVLATVRFSRRLFGHGPNDAYLESLLRDLSLWDKRSEQIMNLSGGMKRRVLIAKALAHEPTILFLDEPTAGVDVSLRKNMWELVRKLRERGVTIILTTHYIEEAEEMADRVGVIRQGEIILVEEKAELMKKLGKRQLSLTLDRVLEELPDGLRDWPLDLQNDGDGSRIVYTFDGTRESSDVPKLLRRMIELGLVFSDLQTRQSSLEEIFVDLLRTGAPSS